MTNGILPYATVTTPGLTPQNFATYTSLGIAPLTTGLLLNTFVGATSTSNVELTAGTAVPGTNVNVNSIMLVGSVTLTASTGGVNYTINDGSGGILATGGGSATISGGTINFGTAEGIINSNFYSSTNLTINSVLTGSGGLTDSDYAILTLAGGAGSTGNTYTGATTMNAGTLLVSTVTSLSSGPVNLIFGSFGTTVATTNFAIANPINLINSQISLGNTNRITLEGPITLTGTNTIIATPTSAVLAGVISDGASGPGALDMTGGSLIITNSLNTYSGGTFLGGGIITMISSSVLSGGTLVSGPLGVGPLLWTGGDLGSARTGTNFNDYDATSITLNNQINFINSNVLTAGVGVNGGGNLVLAGPISVVGTDNLSLSTAEQVTITGQISGMGLFGDNGGGNLSFLKLSANNSALVLEASISTTPRPKSSSATTAPLARACSSTMPASSRMTASTPTRSPTRSKSTTPPPLPRPFTSATPAAWSTAISSTARRPTP